MNGKTLAFFSAALAVVIPASCTATQAIVTDSSRLLQVEGMQSYIASKPIQTKLLRLAKVEDEKVNLESECARTARTEGESATIIKPVFFENSAKPPVQGVWMVRYKLKGCNRSRTYNVVFYASKSTKKATLKTFYPGTTAASMKVVTLAMNQVIEHNQRIYGLKDCATAEVLDMALSKPPVESEYPLSQTGEWNERWTVQMCGRKITTELTFHPDERTGHVSVSLEADHSTIAQAN